MITYGYPDIDLADELALAVGLGVAVLEILPDWGRLPDPGEVRGRVADMGLAIHRRMDAGAAGPSRQTGSTWLPSSRRPIARRSTT